jgi:hypothetical protein
MLGPRCSTKRNTNEKRRLDPRDATIALTKLDFLERSLEATYMGREITIQVITEDIRRASSGGIRAGEMDR